MRQIKRIGRITQQRTDPRGAILAAEQNRGGHDDGGRQATWDGDPVDLRHESAPDRGGDHELRHRHGLGHNAV